MSFAQTMSDSTGRPISIKNTFADMSYIDQVNIKLNNILAQKGLHHIHPSLSFALNELIGNANKANLKRVYFRLNGLELNIPEDYQKGLLEFKSIMSENPYSIETYLSDYKMFVETIFHEYSDKKFTVYVVNNSTLINDERDRIIQKIKNFQELKGDNEAVMNLIDNTEAAGMGLFLSLKLLEQVGIKSESFRIGVHNAYTIAKLSFNYESVAPSPLSIVAKEILSVLKGLPQYPPNVKSLLVKLLDPNITLNEVTNDLQQDPSLSTELLKLVNSAQFFFE